MFSILALRSINSAQINSVKQNNNHVPIIPIDQIPHNLQEFLGKKWSYDCSFDNPNIDKLTGYEEPLEHLQLMPYLLKDITNRSIKFFVVIRC